MQYSDVSTRIARKEAHMALSGPLSVNASKMGKPCYLPKVLKEYICQVYLSCFPETNAMSIEYYAVIL